MTIFDTAAHPRAAATGQFVVKPQTPPECAIGAAATFDITSGRNHMLAAGDTAGKTTVVESPVSDRDRNYHVLMEDGGGVNIDIFMAGIGDPEWGADDEEQLWIGRDGDALVIQYTGSHEDRSYEVADLDDRDREALEEEVRQAVASVAPGMSVEFTNTEPWDCVRGLYSPEQDHLGQIGLDGKMDVTTSNAMAVLEGDHAYELVRSGTVNEVVTRVLHGRGVSTEAW